MLSPGPSLSPTAAPLPSSPGPLGGSRVPREVGLGPFHAQQVGSPGCRFRRVQGKEARAGAGAARGCSRGCWTELHRCRVLCRALAAFHLQCHSPWTPATLARGGRRARTGHGAPAAAHAAGSEEAERQHEQRGPHHQRNVVSRQEGGESSHQGHVQACQQHAQATGTAESGRWQTPQKTSGTARGRWGQGLWALLCWRHRPVHAPHVSSSVPLPDQNGAHVRGKLW